MTKADLYLASQSPRRRELLNQIGVRFEVLQVNVAEVPAAGEAPAAYVTRLAEEKARAGAASRPGAAVLGADTIGVLAGNILEKPRDKADAVDMLTQLSGTSHEVMTAVAVCRNGVCKTRLSVTEVTFRALSRQEIDAYWASGEPHDKAGAYAIQGAAAVFVERLNGSYSGVVGLPLMETQALLAEFQVPWWQSLS